jgi:23S rRNA (uracil1939-C5)-methyltransferase
VNRVVEWTNQEPVADLYAGVGLFAIALAAAGRRTIVAVEGDAVSGADLEANAASQGQSVRAVRAPVEDFLRRRSLADLGVAIVDPPRTGLSAEARAHLLRMQPARLIYVSCDAPTLARDVRALVGEGYDLTHIEAFDLFPNTAHVEILTVFDLRHA